MSARMSLGRQPPPKPSPAFRKRRPIRASCPSASASSETSAPATSHSSAIALMNEIFVARKALALTLTSSAVGRSAAITGEPSAIGLAYTRRSSASARGDAPPKTRRSGASVSSTALPSRRNSGFQTSSAWTPAGAASATIARSRAAVPTGTVDLPTMSASCVRFSAIPRAAAST